MVPIHLNNSTVFRVSAFSLLLAFSVGCDDPPSTAITDSGLDSTDADNTLVDVADMGLVDSHAEPDVSRIDVGVVDRASNDSHSDADSAVIADTSDLPEEPDTSRIAVTPVNRGRDRLLSEYAERYETDRCRVWDDFDEVQRGVFLTITDLLGDRSWLTNGEEGLERTGPELDTALDHVVAIWAIRGAQEEGCALGRCCGGGEFNRLYLSADDALIEAFGTDDGGLPEWGPTSDLAGPHDPFTQSSETINGQPRGQAHFFASDDDAVTLDRPGVEGVLDPHIIEIDIDYNLIHDSNPECEYLFRPGRELYADVWSRLGTGEPVDFDYVPAGCE